MSRIWKAFGYSINGIISTFKSEIAFRQDVFIFIIGAAAAFLIPVGALETGLLISSLFFILFAELVNTAIEVIVNRISEARHPLSGKAKDIGSALVLLSFINAAIVWSAILFSVSH
ncbi:MAG: diacylglycerol kinase [Rickettsiales bacterium]|jgi:diacylglycerol kinase (ATP)|nr:diacylglycerol kinase [Rickettsiales bacterium]